MQSKMKINLKFEESDFTSMQSFEKAIKKQLGNRVYVGTDSLCFYFDYPSKLKNMLRPYPKEKQLEFELNSEIKL